MTGSMYKRSGELMEAELGDELVALEPQAGNCFGFNGVATAVWRSLAEPRSFAQLRDQLLADYDVGGEQCATELQELLDDMINKGLIKRELPLTDEHCD